MGKKGAGGKKAAAAAQSTPQPLPAVPNWPQFKPQLPVTDLILAEPESAPALRDKVLLVNYFWPKSLCRDYVTFLKTLPLTTTPGRPKRGDAVRVNDRFQVNDPVFSRRLWLETGLKEAVLNDDVNHLWDGQVVGLNPNIRIYRYSKNQFFDCHYDESNAVELQPESGLSDKVAARTTWTLLLYLTSTTEGCYGGETVFHPHDRECPEEEIAVAPETGMLLLHKHGDDCLLHEGREVTAGEKWIIRTDLCVLK